MSEAVNSFYDALPADAKYKQSNLIDLFLYFVTIELGEDAAQPARLKECFANCDLAVPAGLSTRLSEGAKSRPRKYIKKANGYRLERAIKEKLDQKVGEQSVAVKTSSKLRALEARFPDGYTKAFLKETVDCFEIKAYRAAIVMCWILTMDHLFSYVFNHHQKAFNSVLEKNKDKRIKIAAISDIEDFSDIPEGKFIEFCRSARVISGDVRKILDEKLGIRNTAAHPSGVEIRPSKAIEFIEDLVTNVILKYDSDVN